MSDHRCPGGCGRAVPRHKLACRNCWFRLPADLRLAVRAGGGRNLQIISDALEWYRADRGGGPA